MQCGHLRSWGAQRKKHLTGRYRLTVHAQQDWGSICVQEWANRAEVGLSDIKYPLGKKTRAGQLHCQNPSAASETATKRLIQQAVLPCFLTSGASGASMLSCVLARRTACLN